MSTDPPAPASKRAQSFFGCVTGSALIGVFLGAGLVSMLLPLPAQFEALRDPIAVGLGFGGLVVTILVSMAPLLMFRSGERKRMDRLFGGLEMTGRGDAGHGAEYRGQVGGRSRSASVSLDGASPVTRHTRASFGLDATTHMRMVWTRRGSPYMQVWSPAGAKHVLLLDKMDVDVRATHPAIARAVADDPVFWGHLDQLLAGIGDAESLVTVGPDHIMLRVDGDGATLFDATKVEQLYATLEQLAVALEDRAPRDTPVHASRAWVDLAHTGRGSMRVQQWAMSLGCVTLIFVAWCAWVGAILWDAI